MGKHSKRDQFYVFTMPGDAMCPVWAEMFGSDGTHTVAPTPFMNPRGAVAELRHRNPGAIVDELDWPSDLAEVRHWAATMPLEQIPA